MCILCHCLAPRFNGGTVPFKSPKDTVAGDSDKKTIILSVPISPQPDDWSLWSKCKYTRRQSQKRGLVIMSDKWPLIAERWPGWGEIKMWLSSRLQTSLSATPTATFFFSFSLTYTNYYPPAPAVIWLHTAVQPDPKGGGRKWPLFPDPGLRWVTFVIQGCAVVISLSVGTGLS